LIYLLCKKIKQIFTRYQKFTMTIENVQRIDF